MTTPSRAQLWTNSVAGERALEHLMLDELGALSQQSGIKHEDASALMQQWDIHAYIQTKRSTLKKDIQALENEQEVDSHVEWRVRQWARKLWPLIIHQCRRKQISGEIPVMLTRLPEGDAMNAERGTSELPQTSTELQKCLHNAIVTDTFAELQDLF